MQAIYLTLINRVNQELIMNYKIYSYRFFICLIMLTSCGCSTMDYLWQPTDTRFTRSYADNTAKLNCNETGYQCKRIRSGESWRSLFPNKEERKMVMSINRTNTSLWAGRRIKIPKDISSMNSNDLSPFPTYDKR